MRREVTTNPKDSDLASDDDPLAWAEHDTAHAQLSEIVAMRLREQIVSGRLTEGQFLRIDAVAKALKVSMTPVREGLLLLQSESFVRLIPRRGFVVNSFTKQDLLDLFWTQATIGAKLAARAATRMSAEEIERLEKTQVGYKAAVASGDQDLAGRLGHQFHRAINIAADSPRLALLLGSLARQLRNRFYASIEGQLFNAVKYHPIILNAIKLRDAKTASSLMYRHVIAAGEHLTSTLERQGVWGKPSDGCAGEPAAAPAAERSRRRPRRLSQKRSSTRRR